jgi:hypothetical protein
MSLSYGSEHRWRHMATIEVDCGAVNFAQLIQDDTLQFQIEAAGKSPAGVQWYLLFMDLACGERRAARTAWAVLTALKRSADAGFIARFRVVLGQQWLTLSHGVDHVEPAREFSQEVPAIRVPASGRQCEGIMACAN